MKIEGKTTLWSGYHENHINMNGMSDKLTNRKGVAYFACDEENLVTLCSGGIR
jgi:hypothetical protein